MESGGGDLDTSMKGLAAIRAQYDLPSRPVSINEYATFAEQVPSASAWFIAQLERFNAQGVRGNWLSGSALHDFLASLLSKPKNPERKNYDPTSGGYFPNGDYQVYEFYCRKMTGYRVHTLPSADRKLDVYATVSATSAIVLCGVRLATGTWTLRLNNLSALGLPTTGSLKVQTWGFKVAASVHYGRVDGPTNLNVVEHAYSDNTVSFPVFQTDKMTAYAFEFAI